jgi:hypothetical protein
MNKLIVIFAAVSVLVGCATTQQAPTPRDCDGPNGVDLAITYGDAELKVRYRIQVRKQNEKIRLMLTPKPSQNPPNGSGIDYRNVTVRLRGKTANDSWLDRDVSANDPSDEKIICVGNIQEGRYQFSVEVPGVGTIDPIVDIVP